MYPYVSNEGLYNLKDYKYSSKDRSLVANYIMQPFWNRAIKRFPLWLAPNLITLLGFFGILVSFLVTLYYSPTLTEPLPRWVYFFNAVCLFYYQTLDALDGKQARRTSSSSALGELFDHGCDAMTTVLTALTTGAALRLGSGPITYVNIVVLMSTFYLSQWDVYFNHVLDLWYVNVTEAQFFGMIIQIIPGILGPDFWLQNFTVAGITLPLCWWAIIPSTLTCVGFSISSMINVGTYALNQNKEERLRVVLYTIPCTYMSILFSFWYYLSPDLLTNHIQISCCCIGFLFCNSVGRFVTARVCKIPYDIFYYNMLPLPIAIINALFNRTFFDEVTFLKFYTIYSVLGYLHFCLCLIDLMTHHLNIKCFRIPYPPPELKQQ
jgi:ethanolaminephosphotransferase